MYRKALLLLVCVGSRFVDSKNMEPFVVGGKPATIELFGHSAFITVETDYETFICGSSIINQHIVLSAAHCFEGFKRNFKITLRAGSANKLRGSVRYAARLAVHSGYNPGSIKNDIALLYVKKPFVFGAYIKRVIIMKHPPKSKKAFIAGWGLIDEKNQIDTEWLQQAEQTLWSREECKKVLKKIPVGCLCGGAKNSNRYASEGDSGSALVIDGAIQVGIVSFKRPEISRALVVYTDVAYFYDWIMRTAQRMHCP